MMRVETISGMLYFGEVFFGTEFVRIVPKRILIYSKEANGYMELDNIPPEVFVPIMRIEVVADIPEEKTTDEKIEEAGLPPLEEETKNDSD